MSAQRNKVCVMVPAANAGTITEFSSNRVGCAHTNVVCSKDGVDAERELVRFEFSIEY